MPKRYEARPVLDSGERNLARRIERLRRSRGWSYETLAKAMTNADCVITKAAIFSIENGDPPRRITVDEMLAFARVFELEVADLLTPPELVDQREAEAIAQQIPQARKALEDAVTEALRLYVSYGRLARESAALREFMDHQARRGWDLLPPPPNVDLGDLVSQDDADALAVQLQVMWSNIVHLGRQSAGLEDRDAD